MGQQNYKNYLGKLKTSIPRIQKACPEAKHQSGIYCFYRYDVYGIKYAYVGKAKDVLTRLAQHLFNFQWIDNSIHKHGLLVEGKENGYEIVVKYCDEDKLDEVENQTIIEVAKKGFQLRNLTIGNGDNNEALIKGESSKGYHDGLKKGYSNCLRDIKEFFDKYLDYDIKEPKLTAKGKPVQIKQNKFNEFKKLLEGEEQ